ncbi:hypothetical protein BCV72DRAFT_248416 [Rhizopus microsporus var. microsporus]|uniref:Uncharacterized protein n=1 Tax=Rhizopus microsporus var. microsporus TaxID=86635 RepID=A0A1X0RAD7_RHIZD|nr:hypothetical protein BCV72DRAFT_248416 [Rhizopus microsporus var. microsporus]
MESEHNVQQNQSFFPEQIEELYQQFAARFRIEEEGQRKHHQLILPEAIQTDLEETPKLEMQSNIKKCIRDLPNYEGDAERIRNTVYISTHSADPTAFANIIEKARGWAIYGFIAARDIDREARNLAIKALKLPPTLKYLETTRFETALLQRAASSQFTSSAHRARGQGRGRYFFGRTNYKQQQPTEKLQHTNSNPASQQ